MRRSTRSVKRTLPVAEAEEAGLSEDEEGSMEETGDADSSTDEWQPEKDKRKGKRGRRSGDLNEESDEDEGLEEEEEEEEEEEDEMMIQGTSAASRKKTTRGGGRVRKSAKRANVVADEDIIAAQQAIEAEEREEQESAQQEAAEMWKQVRMRKEQHEKGEGQGEGQGQGQGQEKKRGQRQGQALLGPQPSASLSSWLGIPEPKWPTTCDEAMINDRDSLFVGFVYPLDAPSLTTISQLLSHLSKRVHPETIPTERLPPAMQHLSTQRRGATHDMHAWRCLALKRGRSGLGGPEDFGLEEGLEDDGERFGAKEIAKIIKQLGATDVLVIVSRWYGGTMLGPIRFQHIENCARAALGQYLIDEALEPLRIQLTELDDQVSLLRSQLGTSTPVVKARYDGLNLDKAQRLILARKKVIGMLQKQIEATAAPLSQPQVSPVAVQDTEEQTHPDPVAHSRTPPSVASQQSQSVQPVAVKEEEEEGVDLTGWDSLE